MGRFLCVCKFSTPLDKYQVAHLLDGMIRLCLVLKTMPSCLHKWLCHFAFKSKKSVIAHLADLFVFDIAMPLKELTNLTVFFKIIFNVII